MKILVISRNSWDDTNAIGNTLSNFFKYIDNVEFANIYFRSSSPNNNLCKKYFCVTETEVIKKWLSPQKSGRQFEYSNGKKVQRQSAAVKNERALVRFIHKHNLKLAYKVSNYIWYSEKWINKNLKCFIESFAPDIVFSFVKSAPQYYLTIRYLRETFNIPLFSWIADDEYSILTKKNSVKEIQNLQYILSESAVVRGCSEEICDYYNSIFRCKAVPLYKGCDLSVFEKTSVNDPIKIVYAGNLLYGRLGILCEFSKAIDEIDSERSSISFEIYSNTAISQSEIDEYFNNRHCTKYMGRMDYEYIKNQLAKADVVLHVESFDDKQILKTKYSFSTKIIDCLQSGSVLLAIGPREISSIKYIHRIPGAYVIDNLKQLKAKLSSFLNDTSGFNQRAQEIRAFAQKYHNSFVNSKELECTIKTIIKEHS